MYANNKKNKHEPLREAKKHRINHRTENILSEEAKSSRKETRS
jgi:hypothetical protein